jgi:hypothetical protein
MATSRVLQITDSQAGLSYEIPVVDGTIRAIDLRQIKVSDDDFGLLSYDPAFQNTASCCSAVTYIDGDGGSCATAVTRSRNWPGSHPSWTSPICSCTASFRARKT